MARKVALTLLLVLLALALAPLWAPLAGFGLPALPPPQNLVELADGTRLHVIDEGRGPAVVLVHGLRGSTEDWRPLPERLVAAGFPARIGVPVVVIQGSADAIVPPATGAALANLIPDSELLIVEDGGHMLPNTHAGILVEAIARLTTSQ